ncbi:hypothetical protein RT97_28260 [Variovorax paradoxus]|uniref:Abortive infection protein-like C-terminal domain-containing protein n=1 Tax=Variovorax paradoxus TaxID=34073 RepID=A0A0D0KUW3_VARPD|nr:hypothetical protein [Variovorax paradoxus]KIQ20578.1 hypothetical protein RT97_28260 [Variovorax paradoxus]
MVFETYSKRQKRLRGEAHEFYTYDSFPPQFLIQVGYLIIEGLGNHGASSESMQAHAYIVQTLREEYGVAELVGDAGFISRLEELLQFMNLATSFEHTLDVIELAFQVIDTSARSFLYRGRAQSSKICDKAIGDLNIRFKEHGLGYQFTNGEIIRIDSELIHVEVVKPLLSLLNKPYFKGAEDEYLSAHEHYRHGNGKEALNDCLKSFESLMMGICDKRGWAYGQKDTSKALIDICLKNGLIPDFWQSQLGGLRSMLEGAIPTGRNRLAGHGQGADPTEVPTHLVSYMLHMTASTLKFLVEADAAMP